MLQISARLTDKFDIRMLGFHLGIATHTVETIFKNQNGNLRETAYEMLLEWRKSQKDGVEAYNKLYRALTHKDVKLFAIANEILKDKPRKHDRGGKKS